MGEISALGSMLPDAGIRSSPCSRSVRDRPRMLPARRVGFRLAFWCRRTTVAVTAVGPRFRPMRVPECKRRRQHPSMRHAGRAQGVGLPPVALYIRSISESARPHRVVLIASSGSKSGWSRGVDPRMGPAERHLGGGRPSRRFARRASWLMPLRAAAWGSPSTPSIVWAK